MLKFSHTCHVFLSATATIASVVWRTTVAGVTFKSLILYSLHLFPLHLFAFTLCGFTNFSTSLKLKNFFAIFQDFFEFSVFPFRHFYAHIENAHKNMLMETQLNCSFSVIQFLNLQDPLLLSVGRTALTAAFLCCYRHFYIEFITGKRN